MRKAFNFYRSYYEIAIELNDKDRLAFYDALLKRQFTGVETELKGMAKFAYVSQKHSIDLQIKGYIDKTKDHSIDPSVGGTEGGSVDPSVQEKEEEKEKLKQRNLLFDKFWKMYGKSSDKKNSREKFLKLSDEEIDLIFKTLPIYLLKTPDVTYRKNPLTYINGKCWNDIDLDNPQIPSNPYNLPPAIWEG